LIVSWGEIKNPTKINGFVNFTPHFSPFYQVHPKFNDLPDLLPNRGVCSSFEHSSISLIKIVGITRCNQLYHKKQDFFTQGLHELIKNNCLHMKVDPFPNKF
jgi:hypothetical protein